MTKQQRLQVYEKYKGHCAYCGEEVTLKEMQIDHITPIVYLRSYEKYKRLAKKDIGRKEYWEKISEREKGNHEKRYGKIEDVNKIENLNPACRECNWYKGASGIEGFRGMMETLHKRMGYESELKLTLYRKYKVSYGVSWDGKFYFEKEEEKC